MRQALRRRTVHWRAIVATVLALGFVLAIAALAWAAPSVSIDTGPSGPTNDNAPVFDFTVDQSATTVECSIDQGTPAYGPCTTAATDSPAAPLPDGDYTFRVRATDDQLEQTEVTQSFTVDTAPPSLSIDSGPSGPTNDASPSFGFTAEVGATVECSIDQGTAAYGPCTTAATDAPGAPLADGSYTFRVQATDAAGNQTVQTQSFTVDTAPPSLSIDSGPSGPTNDASPSFGFTAEVGATVECSIDQGTAAYGPCSGAATDAPGVPLADGSYTFRVQATDAAGNQTVQTQSFTVDTVPPAVGVASGPSGPTNDTTPSFDFTVDQTATAVECSIDQGTPTWGSCTTATSDTVAAPLADGSYVFRVRATDAAGNQAVATQRFSVDTAAPSLSIDSGAEGPTNDAAPSFGFTAEAGTTVECSVDQGTPAYGSCTTATTEVVTTPLADGTYTFRVRATDGLGNQAVMTQSFTVDTVPPSLSIDSGPSRWTRDTTPSFGFTAEAGATVECSVDQGTAAYGPCTTGATDVVTTPLADGAYELHVRATDAAGNQTIKTWSFTVDTTPPSLSIDSGPSRSTNVTMPSFGFTAEAGATVECSIDQGTAAYGPCTSATTDVVASTLVDGSYVLRVRATDAAGNQTVQTWSFTVDTVPPSLSIDLGPSGTTNDNTPVFGFSAEAGAAVACSIDQGAPAYRPCASATGDAAFSPLADGAYTFRVRATDAAGNVTVATRSFTVDTVPDSPRTDPTPPATTPVTPPVTPTPSTPQLLSPFPLVRISGTLTATGARIRLLSVRAPRGALVRVAVTPSCGKRKRSSKQCRVLRAAVTVGGSDSVDFRSLARTYRSGTVIVVRVWRADRIGKYTRFTIVRGKAPVRIDQCLLPAATRGSRCPND